jgi:hypothetical protein
MFPKKGMFPQRAAVDLEQVWRGYWRRSLLGRIRHIGGQLAGKSFTAGRNLENGHDHRSCLGHHFSEPRCNTSPV